jgi:hypothetical protein
LGILSKRRGKKELKLLDKEKGKLSLRGTLILREAAYKVTI